MNKPFPCIESTFDLDYGAHRIRFWRDEEFIQDASRRQNADVLRTLEDLGELATRSDIVNSLANLPGCNAVQAIHIQSGRGIMVYVNWP